LKIETSARDDQQTRLVAEFDSAMMEKYKRQAARKISQSSKIPGFRPGKAPYDLIRRMYGDETLNQEAIELLLDEVYPKVLSEANITASGPGQLDEIISMDPPTFAFIVPLPPEIELGNYQETHKEYAPEPITDEQIEQAIRRMRRSYATAEPVERAAEQGDMVSFRLSARRLDVEEGEDETLIAESPYQLVAGESEDEEGDEWPYEGFSNELVGMSADEVKTVTHKFDEESSLEDLRGKEAEFTITVQNIKKLTLPELNDEFAQSLGEFETLEGLREVVRQQLEQNYNQQYDQNYFDELIEGLVSEATIKYPPHMLEDEIKEFLHGVQHNLERDRLDLETYLKMRDMDRETFIDTEVKPAATRRLERSLVLEEFARRENIEVKTDEVRSIYFAALQQMQQSTELRKMQSRNKQNSQELANSIAINTVNSMFNQRLMSRLKSLATGQPEEEEPSLFGEGEEQAEAGEETQSGAVETEPVESQAEVELVEEPQSGDVVETKPAESIAEVEPTEENAVETVEASESIVTAEAEEEGAQAEQDEAGAESSEAGEKED